VWCSPEKDGIIGLMGCVVGLNWMANVCMNSVAFLEPVNIFTKTETTTWDGKLAKLPGIGQGNIMGAQWWIMATTPPWRYSIDEKVELGNNLSRSVQFHGAPLR
jgi:hypothetical protein